MMASRNLLPLYRIGMRGLGLVASPFLQWRLARGKEDPARMQEKTGVPGRARPPGKLAWLHGASVGEAMALLPLVDRLVARGLNVLVTTGTLTSARILAERLGPGAMHQFLPLDVPRFVNRFLANWRPDIALVAESEIWPNLFSAVKKAAVPMIVVNARLSERSYRRWTGLSASIAALLGDVDLCLAQTQADAMRLRDLGAPRVVVTGNLKYDVPALPADNGEVAILAAAIGSRPVWLAASTHAGEEAMVAAAHQALKARFPHLLTLIAPRHVGRAQGLAQMMQQVGLKVGLRSQRAALDETLDIYIADTMGEMGLFYRLGNIVLVGKSLDCGELRSAGGQNPIEPAKLGNAILHGPRTGNFTEVYAGLDAAGGGLCISDTGALVRALESLLTDRSGVRAMARAAQEIVGRLSGASERTMQALEPYLLRIMVDGGLPADA